MPLTQDSLRIFLLVNHFINLVQAHRRSDETGFVCVSQFNSDKKAWTSYLNASIYTICLLVPALALEINQKVQWRLWGEVQVDMTMMMMKINFVSFEASLCVSFKSNNKEYDYYTSSLLLMILLLSSIVT